MFGPSNGVSKISDLIEEEQLEKPASRAEWDMVGVLLIEWWIRQPQPTSFGPTFFQTVSSCKPYESVSQPISPPLSLVWNPNLQDTTLNHDFHPIWGHTRNLIYSIFEDRGRLIWVERDVVCFTSMFDVHCE